MFDDARVSDSSATQRDGSPQEEKNNLSGARTRLFLLRLYALLQLRTLQSKQDATVLSLSLLKFLSCWKHCESKEAFLRQRT